MIRIAIIDMGTNTFHLLLAAIGKDGYEILLRDHEAVKIGQAGINEGIINAEAAGRAVRAMMRFKRIIGEKGISRVYAYATSAFRNAVNGPSLAAEIEKLTEISIRIIQGDEEAELIYEGIRAAVDLGPDPCLVMDIGAGSVEFIIGNNRSVMWQESFEIGGQRLLEKFQRHDPMLPSELELLERYFPDVLRPLLEALQIYRPSTLVGSSGSFDTLSNIFCNRHGILLSGDEAETPLTIGGFHEIYRELIQKDRAERMKIHGMIELRVDMIVVACCLIRFVLGAHAFTAIRVSTHSLKEGALALLSQSLKDAQG